MERSAAEFPVKKMMDVIWVGGKVCSEQDLLFTAREVRGGGQLFTADVFHRDVDVKKKKGRMSKWRVRNATCSLF